MDCPEGGSRPAATANVRGFSAEREELGGAPLAGLSTIYKVHAFTLSNQCKGTSDKVVLADCSFTIVCRSRALSRQIFHSFTPVFTRCNFLHPFCPIRCQGAGLRLASPCIVSLAKWALLCRGRSRGAIITLPTHNTQLDKCKALCICSISIFNVRNLLASNINVSPRVSGYSDANAGGGKPRLL